MFIHINFNSFSMDNNDKHLSTIGVRNHEYITLSYNKNLPKAHVSPRKTAILSLKEYKNDYSDENIHVNTRTIHHWNNLRDIFINSNQHSIAPEKLCSRIATLLDEYHIPFPIIPLVDNFQKENFFYISNQLKSETIVFSKEYAESETYPHLKFILGHELAHRYNNYIDIIPEPWGEKDNISAIILKHSVVLCSMIYCDNFYYSLLSPYSMWHLLSAYTLLIMRRFYAQNMHKLELECDKTAVTLFGRTAEEKIEIAEEGIRLFKEHIQKSHQNYDLDYLIERSKLNFHSHPSFEKRIQHLNDVIHDICKK